MDRGQKAVYNSLANIFNQIIAAICGFILPRLILSRFGSSYSGITASVSQFLSVIALLRSGIGGATRASLYKSLALKDINGISATINATEIFMRRIALIFMAIIFAFSCIYPYFVRNEFEWFFASSLVLIISISTFVQYFFGITYQILFQADQRQYISSILGIITVILNTIIAVVLIKLGIGIHGVKLGSAIVYCIAPITLNILAKRKYHIDKTVKPDFSSINQRWDAFAHQLATFIHTNTDIALLTIFTNMREISVYTVYYLVANALKYFMNTLSTGVESAFGNIIANNEQKTLREDLAYYESLVHFFSCILFGSTFVLITPFVKVYTMGITDANYSRYMFGYIVVIAEMLYVLRTPYESIVNAAGHFKQTKKYAIFEATINIIVSIILVQKYSILGVVIGTLVAISFRNVLYGLYVSNNILHRDFIIIIRRFLVTGFTLILIYCFSKFLPSIQMNSYINWVIYAVEVFFIAVFFTIFINLLFYKEDIINLIKKMNSIFKRIITVRKK